MKEMKTFKFVYLAVLVSLFHITPAHAIKISEYREFLMRLGFEDYSSQIKANRKKGTGIGTASESVLKFNQGRFEVVNYSRELSLLIMDSLDDSNLSKIIDLDAKLLNLIPFEPPSKFPAEVLAKHGKELEDAKTKYMVEVTKQYISEHGELVLSDILDAMYGAEKLKEIAKNKDAELLKTIKRIQSLVRKIVTFTYLDAEMGHTHFLSRALTANLYRYAQLEKQPKMIDQIQAAAKKQGHVIENYIGDTLHLKNNEGKVQQLTLQNGDFIMERSQGREAGDITFAARPGLKNQWRASQLKLLGQVWGEILPLEYELESTQLTATEFMRMRLSEKEFATRGFSHVGLANVLEDEETGIKMLWAIDNYPNAIEGGIRLSGILEQFAPPGPNLKFGMARYDSKKFWKFAQKQMKEQGYTKVVWSGEKEFIGKDGVSVPQKPPVPDNWESSITEDEYKKLHTVPEKDAAEWHKKINHLMTEYIRHKMLTEDGIGFAYGFSNYKGRTYCSQTVLMAALQSTGLELQPIKDRWNLIAKAMKKLGVEAAADIRTDLRIIAPAGFTWQPIVSHRATVTYPMMTYAERMRGGLTPRILENNRDTTALLRQIVKDIDPNSVDSKVYEKSLTEAIGIAMQGEATKANKRNSTSVPSGTSAIQGFIDRCARLLRHE